MLQLFKRNLLFICVLVFLLTVILFLSFSPLCLKKVDSQEKIYGAYIVDYGLAKEKYICQLLIGSVAFQLVLLMEFRIEK